MGVTSEATRKLRRGCGFAESRSPQSRPDLTAPLGLHLQTLPCPRHHDLLFHGSHMLPLRFVSWPSASPVPISAMPSGSDSSSSTAFNPSGPPPLNYTVKTNRREAAISIFFTLIFVEAGVLPLILFYSIRWGAHVSTTTNLAIITSLVGTYSGYKLARRSYYLFIKDGCHQRRPLGASRFGPDAFTYVPLAPLLQCGTQRNLVIHPSQDTNRTRDDRFLHATRHWLVVVSLEFTLPPRIVLTCLSFPETRGRSTQ